MEKIDLRPNTTIQRIQDLHVKRAGVSQAIYIHCIYINAVLWVPQMTRHNIVNTCNTYILYK